MSKASDAKQGFEDLETASTTESIESRSALKVSGFRLVALAFSTLGVIYSDIGTSPLYVLSTIWPSSGEVPSPEDVIGGISAIFWAFTLLPCIKYIGFALEFGSSAGEGGPFALFLQMFPRRGETELADEDRQLTRYNTGDVFSGDMADKQKLGKLRRFRWPLQILAMVGTALTMADGILTPAVSVTSSVGGLAVVAPVVASNVIPISIGFLVCLFLAQRVGTSKLSFTFAPLTFIWLAILGISGIINTVAYPGIYRAIDPSRAIMYFVRTGNYDALAGVLLAVTGCEAIFANLGQFNKTSIRLSFCLLAYPCLMFAYLGQGAQLILDGATVIQNPFYLSIPGGSGGGLWWLTWIMGVFATLIASQAMITATFSLVHQLIGMKCFPAIRVHYTSRVTQGQVYIPAINWILLIGTCATVGGFGSSFALTLAYGFAVATVMLTTTILLSIQIPFVKHLSWLLGVAFFLCFGFVDGLFWGAALKKVPEGAWFPLALGSVICLFTIFWTWARELEDTFDKEHKHKLSRVIFKRTRDMISVADSHKGAFRLIPLPEEGDVGTLGLTADDSDIVEPAIAMQSQGMQYDLTSAEADALYIRGMHSELVELKRVSTFAIFHKTTDGKGTPHAFGVFIRQFPALPRVVIFLSVRTVAVPHLELRDRYLITKVRSLDGFFGVTMRKGYLDRMTPEVDEIVARIIAVERHFSGVDIENRVEDIRAAAQTPTHVVPAYNIVSRPDGNKVVAGIRKFFVEEFYGRLRVIFPDESSSPESAEETLKVGVVAVI